MNGGLPHAILSGAARMPAAILFTPYHEGVSRHPSESISREWTGKGLRVPADAVIATTYFKDK